MADFACPEKDKFPVSLCRGTVFPVGPKSERSRSSFEVRQLLLEWGARFGVPCTFLTHNAEVFSASIMHSVYQKYNILHRKTPVYEPQSNSSVERGIKSIEEGLRVELLSGAPIQEAVHAVAGRLNRTTSSPCDPVRTPYEVVFKFCEANPPFSASVSTPRFCSRFKLGTTCPC